MIDLYSETQDTAVHNENDFYKSLNPGEANQINQLAYQAGQDEKFSIWRLSYDELIAELADKNLSGQDWDPRANAWVQKGKPLINEDGRHMIRTLVVTYVNKVTSMTNYKPFEVDSEVAKFERDIGSMLSFQGRMLGVDASQRRMIRHSLVALVDAALKKSIDGKERESYMKMLQERFVYSPQKEPTVR